MAIFSGDIFAENYTVSSSVTNVQISSVSGSTKSGDSSDDTHQFSGSLFISGSSIALGDVNNNVVLGRNVNLDVGGSTYSTYIGYQAAGGNSSTELGGQNITVVGTNIEAEVQTVTAKSISGNEIPYTVKPFEPIVINEPNYFDSPRAIYSKENEERRDSNFTGCEW